MNINIISEKIKEKYNSKEEFSKVVDTDYKNLSSKLRTVDNKINSVNEFLEKLDLKLKIVEIK